MNKKIYYYKRNSGEWVFQDQTFTNDREAIKYLIKQRMAKNVAWRLYLDIQEDFEEIKSLFFTPEYWEDRTAEQEAEC